MVNSTSGDPGGGRRDRDSRYKVEGMASVPTLGELTLLEDW